MDYILDGYLYLGSRYTASNRNLLDQHGITAVVNVTPDEPNHFSNDSTFSYLSCPINDDPDENISAYFDVASDFIEQARNEGRVILVHCRGGVSRSPTIIIAYLIKYRDMDLQQAFTLVRKCRRIKPNDGFCKQLIEYEIRLRGSASMSVSNRRETKGRKWQ